MRSRWPLGADSRSVGPSSPLLHHSCQAQIQVTGLPRPAVLGDAVLGQVALHGPGRRVAGHREPPAVPLDAQLQAGAEMTARTPQVLHATAEEEPLGAGKAVLAGPDHPPLVGAARGQAAVPR